LKKLIYIFPKPKVENQKGVFNQRVKIKGVNLRRHNFGQFPVWKVSVKICKKGYNLQKRILNYE